MKSLLAMKNLLAMMASDLHDHVQSYLPVCVCPFNTCQQTETRQILGSCSIREAATVSERTIPSSLLFAHVICIAGALKRALPFWQCSQTFCQYATRPQPLAHVLAQHQSSPCV